MTMIRIVLSITVVLCSIVVFSERGTEANPTRPFGSGGLVKEELSRLQVNNKMRDDQKKLQQIVVSMGNFRVQCDPTGIATVNVDGIYDPSEDELWFFYEFEITKSNRFLLDSAGIVFAPDEEFAHGQVTFVDSDLNTWKNTYSDNILLTTGYASRYSGKTMTLTAYALVGDGAGVEECVFAETTVTIP